MSVTWPRPVVATSLAVLAAACSAPSSDRVTAPPLELDASPERSDLEGSAHGFPAMRTRDGRTLAAGEFTQWLDGDRLFVTIRYDFDPARWVEERSVVRQRPELVQERWSWVETRDGVVHRKFEIDFLAGTATAEKRHDGEMRRWSERIDVTPGRAFAGSIWSLAIKAMRERLLRGETIELRTVGFTPAPKVATVEVSHAGLDRVPMSGREIDGDRFRIHPKIPWIAKLIVNVPDSLIWLAHPPPAAFLRFEGPLAEPDDPIVRVDLLPGEPSGPAVPASR